VVRPLVRLDRLNAAAGADATPSAQPAQLCWHVARTLQTESATQLWLAFATHAFMPWPLTHWAHACDGALFGSTQTGGIVLAVPPHCAKQGAVDAQTQLATTKPMNFVCAAGFALPQHSTQVLSCALQSVQSVAAAQVPPPELVEEPVLVDMPAPVDVAVLVVVLEPVPVDMPAPVDMSVPVERPVDVVDSVPPDVIIPVVAPPEPPLPPLPVLALPPLFPLVVPVVDSELPQAAIAAIDRTIAPNFQDFMLNSSNLVTFVRGHRQPGRRPPAAIARVALSSDPASRLRAPHLDRRRIKHPARSCHLRATGLLHVVSTARNITFAANRAKSTCWNGFSSAFAEGVTAPSNKSWQHEGEAHQRWRPDLNRRGRRGRREERRIFI
jgi:hypothetical protein